MKLSMETCVLQQRYGDEKAFALLRQAGFDGVDYSFYWHEDPWFVKDDYREHAARLKAWLEAQGMACVQAHAPFNMEYGDAFEVADPHYFELVRAIECAAILGAKCIVVHALELPLEARDEEFEEVNYQYYKSLQPYCREFGIQIAVENLFQVDEKRKCCKGMFGSPKALCGILHRLNSDCFTACVDVGHASLNGWEPENFLMDMEPQLLGAVHIQDTDYLWDRHTLPFTADFNWAAITAALKKQNFRGPMNLEIFSYLERFPDSLIPDALALAEKVGRTLIDMVEA